MEHGERLRWLKKHASVDDLSETMAFSADGTSITLDVLLDDVVF